MDKVIVDSITKEVVMVKMVKVELEWIAKLCF